MVKKATMTVSKSNLRVRSIGVRSIDAELAADRHNIHVCIRLSLSMLAKSPAVNACNGYQIVESVDRKEGIVSIVVITALRTMANDTQTLRAKAA